MKELLESLQKDYQAKAKERDDLLAKGEGITIDDITKAEGLNTELKSLQEQISKVTGVTKDAETLSVWEKEQARPGVAKAIGVTKSSEAGVSDKGTSIEVEFEDPISSKQFAAIQSKEYGNVFFKYLRTGEKGLSSDERKSLTEGVDTEGGFLVPPQILKRLLEKKPAPTRVASRVMRIPASSNVVKMPKVNYSTDDIYTTGIRATLTGESPSAGSAHRVTDPVFGDKTIQVGTWMLSQLISNDLIEDSAFPLLSWAVGKFQETIDLLQDNQIINGTGVGANPHGILKNPGGTDEVAYQLSSTANNIDSDQIRGLPFYVPEQYSGNWGWVMNRANCGRTIAQLRAGGSTGEYLFRRGQEFGGIAEGIPDTLDGYPVFYDAFMPNIGDGAYPIIFGDLSGYGLVERVGLSIQVLTERYAEENRTLLLGRYRFGGAVLEPWRMVIGKSDNA